MEEGKSIFIEKISSYYEIGAVTEKAVMLKCSDGRWSGDGYKPLWVSKSLINVLEDKGDYYRVNVPEWWIIQNRKRL